VGRFWGGDDHDLSQFPLVLNRRGNGPGQRGDHHGRAKNGEEVVHESGHFVVIVRLLEVRRVSIGGHGPAAEGGEGRRPPCSRRMSLVEPVHEGVDGIRLEVLKRVGIGAGCRREEVFSCELHCHCASFLMWMLCVAILLL